MFSIPTPLRASGPLLALAALACAKTPPAPPAPPPPPMRYEMPPAGQPLRYVLADTTEFELQSMRTHIASRALVELRFAPDTGGAGVTARVLDFDGRFDNPAVGTALRADETGAIGTFTFVLTPRGVVQDLRKPRMSEAFAQVSREGDIIRAIFLRVPDRPVRRGAAWTDTIDSEEETEGVTARNRSIVTSTWTRDSVVAGRTLNVIESRYQNFVELTGNTAAGGTTQRMDGVSSAVWLWDPQRGIVVSRSSHGQLQGELHAADQVLPVRVTLRSAAELQPPAQ